MQPFERDFFISRICAGYLRYKGLVIENPNLDVLYEANEIYCDTFLKAKENGVMSDEEILNFLIENKFWVPQNTIELDDILPKHIEQFKINLYEERLNLNKQNQVRQYLARAKEEQLRLYNLRHSFDHLTCHGAALFARLQFIIDNCTKKNNKKYRWTKISRIEVLEAINSSQLTESQYRELSRTEPWRSIWATKKVGPIFNKSGSELTEDQKRLISFSCLYDNISEFPDCPSDEIIEDDDCLDGWLILKRREQDKERGKNEILEKVGSNINANEIFVVTGPENADKVYGLNDAQAQMITRSRLEMVKNKEDVNYTDFGDIKQEFMMQVVNAQRAQNGR